MTFRCSCGKAESHGAVIGGIAVVLHGHVRTTKDIDIFVDGSLQPLGELLIASGFTLDSGKKEFIREGIPVHLVTIEQLKRAPRKNGRDRRNHDDFPRRPDRDQAAERQRERSEGPGSGRRDRSDPPSSIDGGVRTQSGQDATPDLPQADQGAEAGALGLTAEGIITLDFQTTTDSILDPRESEQSE